MVPNILLHVSFRELNTNLVVDPNDDGIKEANYEEDNIIISYSTLWAFFHRN